MDFNVVGKIPCDCIAYKQKQKQEVTANKKAEYIADESVVSSADALANQKMIIVKKPKTLEKFDVESLPDEKSKDVFAPDELAFPPEGVSITETLNLGYSYMAEQIRYFEATGELIPWKTRELLEQAQYLGLNAEETKEFIQNEKEKFTKEVEKQKELSNKEIDVFSPTKAPHSVYRVITSNPNEITKKYFDKINALKSGNEVVLSSIPMYVSTSAKKVMQNYGVNPSGGVLFKINLPEGSKLMNLPSGDGIEQLIMRPDSKFKVVETKEYDNNFRTIELDYLFDEN